MLQAIKIASQATYAADGQRLDPCKQVNFIFGTNGSGKTTISRLIADPAVHASCQLTWTNGRELERLVYNSDFVENNFKSTVKGIFTHGKESVETLEKIDKAKDAQHDDLYISADGSVVKRYLSVFKQIFGKTKHMGHYRMMMGIGPDAEVVAPLAADGASAAA